MKLFKQMYRRIFRGNYQLHQIDRQAFEFFKDCQKILDVGCGDGRFMRLDPSRIEGVDGNRDSVKLCRKQGLRAKYGKVTNLPYWRRSFDGIHCSHVIEHLQVEDAHKLLSEIDRVLRVGGVVVLRSPLLWSGFFDDFSHVKPYNPSAILRYMVGDGTNKTLGKIRGKYEKLALIWRYKPVLDILYPLGVRSSEKNGYLLALKKSE